MSKRLIVLLVPPLLAACSNAESSRDAVAKMLSDRAAAEAAGIAAYKADPVKASHAFYDCTARGELPIYDTPESKDCRYAQLGLVAWKREATKAQVRELDAQVQRERRERRERGSP